MVRESAFQNGPMSTRAHTVQRGGIVSSGLAEARLWTRREAAETNTTDKVTVAAKISRYTLSPIPDPERIPSASHSERWARPDHGMDQLAGLSVLSQLIESGDLAVEDASSRDPHDIFKDIRRSRGGLNG